MDGYQSTESLARILEVGKESLAGIADMHPTSLVRTDWVARAILTKQPSQCTN
jgi:hypothetical protein